MRPSRCQTLSDPVEAPRLRDEEYLDMLGFRIVEEPWHRRGVELARLSATLRIGEDRPGARADLTGALHAARGSLTPGEVKRMRDGGRQAAEAMLSALGTASRRSPGPVSPR
jgi:Xaa-Pro aminopeptidase